MYNIHFQIGMNPNLLRRCFVKSHAVLPLDLDDKQPRPDLYISVDMQEPIYTLITERFKEVKENVKLLLHYH